MIRERLRRILEGLPEGVEMVVATKGRGIEQVEEAILAGAKIIGENYVQEAEEKFKVIGKRVSWHLLGHLQKNKVKKAVKIFDMIETLDSLGLAEVLDKESRRINKLTPVLIEINSAKEPQKTGIFPEDLDDLVRKLLDFKNLSLEGLMTMGPLVKEPERTRPFFRATFVLFEKIKRTYPQLCRWRFLSMGMSDTYKIAIEERANLVRIGRAIFEGD